MELYWDIQSEENLRTQVDKQLNQLHANVFIKVKLTKSVVTTGYI
jgi:hypothetical protein